MAPCSEHMQRLGIALASSHRCNSDPSEFRLHCTAPLAERPTLVLEERTSLIRLLHLFHADAVAVAAMALAAAPGTSLHASRTAGCFSRARTPHSPLLLRGAHNR